MFRSYPEIYAYYKQLAEQQQNKNLRILKTDSYNESGLAPTFVEPLAPILANGNTVTCIEIDDNTRKKAADRFPELAIHQGDIRTWQGEYDLIMDFSTIDHVENWKDVLKLYKQNALKLSVVVWLADESHGGDKQYWFCHTEFRDTLKQIYGDCQEKVLFEVNETKRLAHFVA